MVTRDVERERGEPSGSAETVPERLLARLPVSERRMDLVGISTAVLEGGEGPPLVLLHGPGEFALTWMRVIPELVGTRRVVVPDLPGHGASGLGDADLGRDRVVAWLGELIDRTCPSPPVVVGHLLGGAIAARFAVQHGDRLDRLVLLDSFGLGRLRPAASFAVAMLGFVVRPTERSQERLFRRCMADLDGVRSAMEGDLELLEAYALELAQGPDLKRALRALMPAFAMTPIPPEGLERLDVPTTLIWGRDDLQVRLRTAEVASDRYGWPLHVIDDCADDPAVEQPRAFLEALSSALGAPR